MPYFPVNAVPSILSRHRREVRVKAGVVVSALLLTALQLSCDAPAEPMFTPFDMITGIAIADLNNDGVDDIVVASTHVDLEGPTLYAGSILVCLQRTATPGTFDAPVSYPAGPYPWGVTVADINLDGAKDVMTVGENTPDVFIHYGKPALPGSFDSVVTFPCGPAPYDIAVGDLNHDGLPDLAIGCFNNTVGSVSLLFQDRFHPKTFLPDTIFSSVTTSLGIAIGDLNGDGSPDIAATGRDGIWVITSLPSSPGQFNTPILVQAGVRPQDLALGDLNGDGRLEIAVANAGSSSDGTGSTLSIITGLSTVQNFPSPDGTRALVVGDFNNDGRPDVAAAALVVQSQADGKMAVWLQDTTGVLGGPGLYAAGNRSTFIAAGDLNHDGKVDLAVTDPLLVAFQDSATPGLFLPVRGIGR